MGRKLGDKLEICLFSPGPLTISQLEKIEPDEKTYPESLKKHTQKKAYISAHELSTVQLPLLYHLSVSLFPTKQEEII